MNLSENWETERSDKTLIQNTDNNKSKFMITLVEKKEYILDNPRFLCVYTRLNSDANVKSENEAVSVSGISDYVIDSLIIMNARADGQWNSSAQIQFF